MKRIELIILAVFISASVFAQEENKELVTDRPDQTESSVVVPHKSLQIEMGFGLSKDEVGAMEFQTISLGSTLLRYGLFESTELRLGFGYDVFKTSI